MNSRLVSQFTVAAALFVLPVTMIALNGSSAIQAILRTDAGSESPESGQAEVRTSESTEVNHASRKRFGAYDPHGVFTGEQDLSIRHLFMSWSDFESETLKTEMQSLCREGFEILLTIEPWPKAGLDTPLLPSIVAGHYDDVIDEIVTMLRGVPGRIYISWGHEMDQDLTQRYPWSGQDPQHFVAAYRHFVNRIRSQLDTMPKWVWAGVLKDGSLEYWPGEDFVDVIGLPIYSFPEWDRKTYGFIRDFQTTCSEKHRIVAGLGKPLMITEMGVSGSDDFESFWLHQAFSSLHECEDLNAVVFFYARDTENAWGNAFETPDWRIHPDAIRSLVRWNLN